MYTGKLLVIDEAKTLIFVNFSDFRKAILQVIKTKIIFKKGLKFQLQGKSIFSHMVQKFETLN